MRTPNTICSVCAEAFYKRPSAIINTKGDKHFCSRECYGKSCRSDKKGCLYCGSWYPIDKRRRKYCSRACSNKARTGIKYNTGRPNDLNNQKQRLKWILIEQRGPKCEYCSHDNVNILQIHHIIEQSDGGTDELDNLLLLCPNCHMTIHYGDSLLESKAAS